MTYGSGGRKRVLVTRRMPKRGMMMLEERFDVVCNPHDRELSHKEFLEMLRSVQPHALVSMLSDRVDDEALSASADLKVVSNYAVGFNNIDTKAASGRGIYATNTPGVLTDATADLAWALLMACSRRIAEGDRYVREGRFKSWAPMLLLGGDVAGRTIGIVGAGRIGQAVARRAAGFGMKILYWDVVKKAEMDALGAKSAEFETLVRESDFVTLHVPFTPETKHLFGWREFCMMKQTAYFINTARGACHDEAALVAALRDGKIAGAGLDVYENEPALAKGLAELENVVLVPHIGSATTETRDKMAMMVAENVIAALDGKRPPNAVNDI
ncbi:MAG: D-glycerate dehydrogenase [Thermoplasmata archaeon HGW-Thermoplasmata-1]|nr:MAG: D-glycerate dehydrogenase [Thermoplasmata archaeon HGW-Thermoplasmata-1]